MESDRKGKVLNIDSNRDLCPLCPQKIRIPVRYTVSENVLFSVNAKTEIFLVC